MTEQKNTKVTLKTALQDYFRGYFNFTGETSRASYWWVMLLLIIVWLLPFSYLLTTIMIGQITGQAIAISGSMRLYYFLMLIVGILLFIPTIALNVRRYRNVGLRGRGTLTLLVLNGLVSSFAQNSRNPAWRLLTIVISMGLFITSLQKTGAFVRNSENPMVNFFFKKAK